MASVTRSASATAGDHSTTIDNSIIDYGTDRDWSDLGNLASSDDAYATAEVASAGVAGQSYRLDIKNWGFSIPTGSTIDGVVVSIECGSGNTTRSIYESQTKLLKSGSPVGDNKASATITTETTLSRGGSSDLWGTTLSVSDVNSSSFGVALQFGRDATTVRSIRVDHVEITVHYTEGGGATGTLAATETGSDTASLTGDVLVQGALSATETGIDVAAFAGDVLITGTLDATETGTDTAALTGDVLVQGALDATETGSDTASFVGEGASAPVTGSLDATEAGQDTAFFNGSSAIISTGALDATETGSDTAAFTGNILVLGALAAVEVDLDTAVVFGKVYVEGALAANETGNDTASFQSAPGIMGYLEASEAGFDYAEITNVYRLATARSAGRQIQTAGRSNIQTNRR